MIDLVLGAAQGYSEKQLRPFLASLRNNGYRGRIVLYADKGGAREAAKWCAEVRKVPSFNGTSHGPRFLWLRDELNQVTDCRAVLVVDTRDVIFQKDLTALPSYGLNVFEEDRSMTIAKCPYNSMWMRTGYGQQVLDQLGHFHILCVGTFCGGIDTVRHYLNSLAIEIEHLQPKTSLPQDQAAHNFLIRCKEDAKIWKNEEGEIYTPGYIYPRDTVKFSHGKIKNRSENIPTVVHQWDRHPSLVKMIGDLYD
jgi:hypothetical protein